MQQKKCFFNISPPPPVLAAGVRGRIFLCVCRGRYFRSTSAASPRMVRSRSDHLRTILGPSPEGDRTKSLGLSSLNRLAGFCSASRAECQWVAYAPRGVLFPAPPGAWPMGWGRGEDGVTVLCRARCVSGQGASSRMAAGKRFLLRRFGFFAYICNV